MTITTRLTLSLRRYQATKRLGVSLETQYRAVRELEKILGEACDALSGLAELERSELARVMRDVEAELRRAVEKVSVTS